MQISRLRDNKVLLHCIALHCIALHCIALHCIALHCIALHKMVEDVQVRGDSNISNFGLV